MESRVGGCASTHITPRFGVGPISYVPQTPTLDPLLSIGRNETSTKTLKQKTVLRTERRPKVCVGASMPVTMKGTPSASSRSSTGWSPTKHVRCLQTPGRIICTRAKCQPLVAQKKNKNRGTDRLALFLSGVHFVCVCVVCRSPGRPEMRRGTRMMRSFRRRLALLLPRTAGSSRSDLLRNRTRSSRLGSRRTWRRCPCGATQNSTARGSVRLSRRPALLRCSSCPPVDFCLCLHVASTSSSSVIRTSNRAFKSVRIRQYSGADAYPYVSECGASVPLCAELPVCVLMCAQRVR
jgi:hypothetical protein